MAATTLDKVSIRGIVCSLPGAPLRLEELCTRLDADELEKVKKTVGLSQLYRVKPGQTAGDLCVAAAEKLLTDLAWDRESVDAVIMVTQTPDHFLPATACIVHGKLALSPHCLAFDVGMGCSGYVYGLWMAGQFINSGTCRRVLLLAGDTISRLTSPEDKSVAVLFGDAGSATALEYNPLASSSTFVLGTDGNGTTSLQVPAGGFRLPGGAQPAAQDEFGNMRSPSDLYMDGLAVFNFTMQRVPPLVTETIRIHGWTSDDVQHYVFHQANAFIINRIAKKLGLPADRVPLNISKYGNTSMVSIPLVLADELAGAISSEEGVNLLCAGFGVGLSWAGAALHLSGVRTAEVISV